MVAICARLRALRTNVPAVEWRSVVGAPAVDDATSAVAITRSAGLKRVEIGRVPAPRRDGASIRRRHSLAKSLEVAFRQGQLGGVAAL